LRDAVKDMASTMATLERVLALDPSSAQEKLRAESRFKPTLIAADIDRRAVAYLEEHRLELPGVRVEAVPRRRYPLGSLGSHFLGHLGEITEGYLRQSANGDYRQGDIIGVYGLERDFERYLKGTKGFKRVEVDAYGRELRLLFNKDQIPGNTLILTIDLELQKRAAELFSPYQGALIAMDPRNGQILAMVSNPSFDPNLFAGGISRENWQKLMRNPLHPLHNRALQGQYPPGSVYKIVVAAAGLEEGVITPDTTIYDPGYFYFGRRTYRDWKPGGHGIVDLKKAIRESCDVYFYRLGQKLGIDRMARYARGFGLGKKTGLSMRDEREGVVPSRKWKRAARGEPWYPGETISAAIGQGFNLVTPIQLLNVMASVANGGTLYRPHLVQRVLSPEGREVYRARPEVLGRLPVRARNLRLIQEALRAVVNERGGTAFRARLKEVVVAGKTGTAQVMRLRRRGGQDKLPREQRDHGWFVAYAPFENPSIAVIVFVEHGGKHGAYYAPLAMKLIQAYLKLREEKA
ncbi:MAG: penicillin-binding protein 2, partial [Nitrospinota bacterium]